ncbi:ATP-binding protein [Uliginosibacterium sp. H3]|uniref:histidine kinase n=1 Tax=Uliginosibacterium silvisoli TaxID=3114758 RepID=A0ABU6K2W0_9RHOO|nr:ATP-binding protein [Uliginosibacterium sp. H3]
MNLSLLLAHWSRLVLVAVALLALTAVSAIYLEQSLEEQALSPLLSGEKQRALRRAESFQRSLKVPVSDVIALSRSKVLRQAVQDYSAQSLDRLAEVGATLAESGITYEKVRLLDAHGKERMRINLRGRHAVRVPERELQDKSGRYFFTRPTGLADGEVFISRIDLDVDNDKIQVPHLPTLRVATPIRHADGSLGGVLVLNVAVDSLTPIFNTAVVGAIPVWMTDSAGFWLKGPKPELEWGFQLNRPDARLSVFEPEVARAAESGDVVQLTTPSGLWTLGRVDLPASKAIAAPRPEFEQFRSVHLISRVPAEQLESMVAPTRRITLITAICVGLLLVVLTSLMILAFEARKQQARDAENARHRLRLALVGGGLSMWIADLTSAGVYLNASWQKITGYPQGPSTMDAWLALIHADDRSGVLEAFALMRSGQRSSVETILRLRHQDGHWLTLGLYGGVVDHTQGGTPAQAAGVLRDLSLIEQSEKRLALAMLAGDVSWWDWNVPGNVVSLDARWALLTGDDGETRQELLLPLASVFEDAVHLEDRAALSAAITALLSGQRGLIAADYRLRRRDGDWTWILARGEVMERSENGSPTRVLGTFKDITQRKRLELELREERRLLEQRVAERTQNLELARQEAERANTAKNTFLANISHEMRTPMHGIIGFSDMGQKLGASAPAEVATTYFSAINQSAARLLTLLNDLLDMSKLESGMMSFHPERIDPVMLIDSNVSELQALAQQKNLRLQLQAEAPLPSLHADPIRIGQVVRNLLANSIRYSPEDDVIRIELSALDGTALDLTPEEGVLRLVVSDHGCGIPPDELESIFDKFVQSTRTRSGAGGTGLGLSICRDIVSFHKGRIRAFNNPEGGATFEVLLPARHADDGSGSANDAQAASRAATDS